MKKYLFLLGIIGLLILTVIIIPNEMIFQKIERIIAMNYYFPKEFNGCAIVFYNISRSPPLQWNDGIINYYFDDRGILMTSSAEDFGLERNTQNLIN